MSIIDKLNDDDMTMIVFQLTDASKIMRIWADRLKQDNDHGQRNDDIVFLQDRSRRYAETVNRLRKPPTERAEP